MKQTTFRVEVNQYAGGHIATAYDKHGLSIIDGESNQPTEKDAVESLLFWLNKTRAKDEQLVRVRFEGEIW